MVIFEEIKFTLRNSYNATVTPRPKTLYLFRRGTTDLILPGGKQVEESNDCALKLGATTGVDSGGAEGLPDDGFADVGGDEEGDPAAKAITLLKQLVQQQHNETGHKQLKMRDQSMKLALCKFKSAEKNLKFSHLDDDQQTDTSADVTGITVHPSQDVDDGLIRNSENPYFQKNCFCSKQDR